MPTKKTRSNAPKAPADATPTEVETSPAGRAVEPVASEPSGLSASIGGWVAAAERHAREEPLKCAGVALAVVAVGSVLPIGRLIGSIVRPVLLIAGLVKVLEEVERRRNS